MKQYLDTLNKAFPSYFEAENALFIQQTNEWDPLFKEDESVFYRALFYIIQQFLKSDRKQLFIRIPATDLGYSEKNQELNFNRLQCLMSDILYLSTSEEIKRGIECPNLNDTEIGDYYYNYREKIFWEIQSSRNDGGPRPHFKELKRDNENGGWRFQTSKSFTTREVRERFSRSQDKMIKVSVGNEAWVPRKFPQMVDQIETYLSLAPIANYKRGILVGYNQNNWGCRPINSSLFPANVIFFNRYERIQTSSSDIVVFVGDKKYLNFRRELYNSIALGKVKKIVYVGTEIFDGFEDREDAAIYSFSYRELFSYFAKGRFPEIIPHILPFDWLMERISEFNGILPERLPEEDKRRITKVAIFPLLKIDGLTEIDTSFLNNFLENECDFLLNPKERDSIVTWLNSLHYDGSSPKRLEADEIIGTHNSCTIELPYKKKVSKFIKESNRQENLFVIDVVNNNSCYVDIVKYLLQNCCLGKYHLLSYVEMNSVFQFFKEEVNVYNDSYRGSLLNNLKFDLGVAGSETNVSNNLLDYYDPREDNLNSLFLTSDRQVQQTKYSCTFEDGSSFDVDGDVIYHSGTMSIDEIYKEKEEMLPCDISYYKTPSNFQHLMEIYYNFPERKTVSSFSSLWKDKMRSLYSECQRREDKVRMSETFNIRLSKLQQICREGYTPLFPDEIERIAAKLAELDLITEEQSRMIRAANNVVNTHRKKAKELKYSLMQYKLYDRIEGVLKVILDNVAVRPIVEGEPEISAESIANDTIIENRLITINKLQR